MPVTGTVRPAGSADDVVREAGGAARPRDSDRQHDRSPHQIQRSGNQDGIGSQDVSAARDNAIEIARSGQARDTTLPNRRRWT